MSPVAQRTVDIQETGCQQLIAPLQFFVEVSSFAQMKGFAPAESDMTYKKFQGCTLAGVAQQSNDKLNFCVCAFGIHCDYNYVFIFVVVWRSPCRQVACAGREWLMAWEDGMRGVYKLEDSSQVPVTKNHEVISSDERALVDNLVNDTQNHFMKEVLGTASGRITTDPNMSRASQLLCLGGFEPAIVNPAGGENVPIQLPTASAAASGSPAAPECEDDARSMMGIVEMLRPQHSQVTAPKAAPKKATGKAKAGKGGGKAGPPAQSQIDVLFPSQAVTVTPQPAPGPQEPPAKRMRMSTIENMEPSLTSNMAAHMAEADQTWATTTLQSIKELSPLNPREADTEFKADVAEALKKCGTLLTQIKARKRLLKRRTPENREAAMAQADEMEQHVSYIQEFLKGLNNIVKGNAGSGDDCCGRIETMMAGGFVLGVEVYKRIAKQMLLDDVKLQRYDSMSKVSWPFIRNNIDEANVFLGQQAAVLLQKVLKGIALDKARSNRVHVASCYFPLRELYKYILYII